MLKRTDRALIVSPGQNEIEQLKKHGLDIVPHRKRMNESQPSLDEKFKNPDDPLRIVFVCAMTEEELVIFDILTRPAPELSAAERADVKKVARELLNRLKSLLVLNWRQKSSARSQLKLAIEDVLDTGLPRAYDKPLYEQKCWAVFEHVYESYPERDAGAYAEAG